LCLKKILISAFETYKLYVLGFYRTPDISSAGSSVMGMIDTIELIFYIIDTVLLTAIFLLEYRQFRKEDEYMNNMNMNGHKNSAGVKPLIAQAESNEKAMI